MARTLHIGLLTVPTLHTPRSHVKSFEVCLGHDFVFHFLSFLTVFADKINATKFFSVYLFVFSSFDHCFLSTVNYQLIKREGRVARTEETGVIIMSLIVKINIFPCSYIAPLIY